MRRLPLFFGQDIMGFMEEKHHKPHNFLKRFIAGVVLGIGAILPGVSGGIMAVAMGLYRKMIDSIYTFFKAPKKNGLFLLPLAIGAAAGLLGVSLFLEPMMERYQTQMMYLFIGLVAGGIPGLWREGVQGSGFKWRYLIFTVIGVGIIFGMSGLTKAAGGDITLPFNFWTAMLCGGVISLGTVIPGMSTSFILMFLGIYEPMLQALNRFEVGMLLGALLGIVIVAGALIKFVRMLFDKFPNQAYFAVLGFLSASVILIFPGFEWSLMQILNIVLLVGGFLAAVVMERAMNKMEAEEPAHV